MTRAMGEPFYGTGKPPEGWKDGDYVELFPGETIGWKVLVSKPLWYKGAQYRLEANHPFYRINTMIDLQARVAKAVAAYNALSPEEKAAHDEAQRQSWVRGMGPCEHGVYDFETCPQCRKPKPATDAELIDQIKARNPGWNPPALPDRAEALARGWYDNWVADDCLPTGSQGLALLIARKLIAEGVL